MSTMRLGEILGSVDNGWHPFGTRIKLCPDWAISEGPVKVGEDTMATVYV